MTVREIPQWVINHVASPLYDPRIRGGFVLKRDGVIIDRWPDDRDIIEGNGRPDAEPVGIFEAMKAGGFWRDAGHGVEQWVTPR